MIEISPFDTIRSKREKNKEQRREKRKRRENKKDQRRKKRKKKIKKKEKKEERRKNKREEKVKREERRNKKREKCGFAVGYVKVLGVVSYSRRKGVAGKVVVCDRKGRVIRVTWKL